MVETSPTGLVTNWATFVGGDWSATPVANRPAFWMTTFKSPLQAGAFLTLQLSTKGLSTGSVWVNGHNLGRLNSDSGALYVPECWLTDNNTMVVYDASGNSPNNVQLQYVEKRARYASGLGTAGAGGAGGGGGGGAPGTGGVGGRSNGGAPGMAGTGAARRAAARRRLGGSGGSGGSNTTGGTRRSKRGIRRDWWNRHRIQQRLLVRRRAP